MGAPGRGPNSECSLAASSADREVSKDRKPDQGSQGEGGAGADQEESRSEPLGDAIYKQPERALGIMIGQQRPDSQGLTGSQEAPARAGMKHGGLQGPPNKQTGS